MSRPIPKRPNLEFDRKQAKALLVALRNADPEAWHRFGAFHPGGIPAEPKLTDAQLVIAREYGFPSWPAWKGFVETRGLDRKRQAEVVLRAVCSNDLARARVLLQSDPDLAREDFYLACACGELAAVEAHLRRDPKLADRAGGINRWDPIQYACFSRWLRCDPDRTRGIVQVVRRLLELGADANAFHMIDWMNEPWKETVLFAAAGIANHPELTQMLLAAGADVNEQHPIPDPTDPKVSPWGTEVLYHTCEFRDLACLRLLLAAKPHAFTVSFCMARVLDFENVEAIQVFLGHGADPNFRIPWFGNRTHLHHAVERGRSAAIVEALLLAGADPMAADEQGLTPYRVAVRYGREDLARLMEDGGAKGATERDRELGDLMNGHDAGRLSQPVAADFLCAAARANDVGLIGRLIRAGADVNVCDAGPYGTPPLHWAAWRGQFEAVRAFVEHGADLRGHNAYGGDALGTAIHGSANCFDLDGGPAMRLPEEALPGDYPRIVEYLISAGARLPKSIHGGSDAVQNVLRRLGVPDEGEQDLESEEEVP